MVTNIVTDANGNFSTDVTFTAANGWVAGAVQDVRAYFAGSGTYTASASPSTTITMDSGTPVGESLTLTIVPNHGVIPWSATLSGELKNASGVGIANATIKMQFSPDGGATWADAGPTVLTNAAGAYIMSGDFFTAANGWTPGSVGTLRTYFAGDGTNAAIGSAPVTVTMDTGPVGTLTTLTFTCSPTHGTLPWSATFSGRLTNQQTGAGIPNASILIQFWSGVAWGWTGWTITTDANGYYSQTANEFNVANGWTAGATGQLRAYYAGDATYAASSSNAVTVTMDGGITVSVSATLSGMTATVSGTISGGSAPYTYVINWGDGTTTSGSGSAIAGSHTYSAAGAKTIAVTATDSAGGTGSGTTTVTFNTGTVTVMAYSGTQAIAASVTLNGSAGTTTIPPASPLSFQLTAGTYTLTGTYQGETLPSQQCVVVAGQTTSITLQFPANFNLIVTSAPVTGIPITVDGASYTTPTPAISLKEGAHAVNVPSSYTAGGATYVFQQWEDGSTSLARTVNLTSDKTVTATYVRVKWNLVVSSTPVTGIPITVDGVSYTTNTPNISLDEGNHTVVVPANFTSGTSVYAFAQWEDGTVATTRVVQLNTNKSIIATYALVYRNLTVNTTPITGIQFTVDGTAYVSNASVSVLQGSHTVTVPQVVANGSNQYSFSSWENGSTALSRTVSVVTDTTIVATYVLVKYNLTVNSSPSGVPITVDGASYTTNTTVSLNYGQHTIVVPQTFVSGPTTYTFQRWEDNSTSLNRTVTLAANTAVTATYVAIHPTLTLVSSPVGAGTLTATPPPSPPYEVGQTVVISASAVDPVNYTFVEWLNEDGTRFSASATTSIALGTINRTLTARFTSVLHPTLTLQVNPSGVGGTITASPSPPYNVGQNVTVTATPPTGYKITGWTLDGATFDGTNATVTVQMNSDHILVVTFEQIKWNLTVATSPVTGIMLTIDGATYNSNATVSLAQGSHTVVVPQNVTSGGKPYTFKNWEDNSKNTTRVVQLTADGTITAFFGEVSHSLTVNSVPTGITPITVDGNPYTAPVSLSEGTHVVVVPQTAVVGGSNYAFLKWEDGSTSVTRTINLLADTTVTASYQYVTPTHNLNVVSQPLTNIPVQVDTATYVTNTPAIPLLEGSHTIIMPQLVISGPSTYNFKGWEDGSVNATRTLSLTADKTITATYEKIVPILTLNVSPVGAGTVSATPAAPYDKDQVVVVAATVNDPVNFRWVKWIQEDGSDYSTQQTTSVTMNKDRSLTAVFESITHPTLTLVANPTADGTIAVAESPPYTVGQVVHVTATPSTGRIVIGWLLDGAPFNGTSATITVTLDVSHVVTANFSPVVQAGFPWWALVVAVPAAVAVTYTYSTPGKGKRVAVAPKRRPSRRKR